MYITKWCGKINSPEVVIGRIGKAGKQDSGHLIRRVGDYNIAVYTVCVYIYNINIWMFIYSLEDTLAEENWSGWIQWGELKWLNTVNIKYITDFNKFSPIYLVNGRLNPGSMLEDHWRLLSCIILVPTLITNITVEPETCTPWNPILPDSKSLFFNQF